MASILSQALRDEVADAGFSTATFQLGGKEYKVGSKPVTAMDFQVVNKTLPVDLQQNPLQFMGQIDMLIRKTRMVDDEGDLSDNKAFDLKDKQYLQSLGAVKITEMFGKLFKDQFDMTEPGDIYDESKGLGDDGEPKDQVGQAKGE